MTHTAFLLYLKSVFKFKAMSSGLLAYSRASWQHSLHKRPWTSAVCVWWLWHWLSASFVGWCRANCSFPSRFFKAYSLWRPLICLTFISRSVYEFMCLLHTSLSEVFVCRLICLSLIYQDTGVQGIHSIFYSVDIAHVDLFKQFCNAVGRPFRGNNNNSKFYIAICQQFIQTALQYYVHVLYHKSYITQTDQY